MATDLLTTGRVAVALLAGVVLVYWTWRRAMGDGDDPTLRLSKRSEAGTTSVLFGGVHAVLLVALIAAVALFPELQAQPGIAVVLVGVVAAHWVVEKRERA